MTSVETHTVSNSVFDNHSPDFSKCVVQCILGYNKTIINGRIPANRRRRTHEKQIKKSAFFFVSLFVEVTVLDMCVIESIE